MNPCDVRDPTGPKTERDLRLGLLGFGSLAAILFLVAFGSAGPDIIGQWTGSYRAGEIIVKSVIWSVCAAYFIVLLGLTTLACRDAHRRRTDDDYYNLNAIARPYRKGDLARMVRHRDTGRTC